MDNIKHKTPPPTNSSGNYLLQTVHPPIDEPIVNILGIHKKSEGRMIQYLDLNFKEDARPYVKETPKDPGQFNSIKEFFTVASGFGFLSAVFSINEMLGDLFVPVALIVAVYIGILLQYFLKSSQEHKLLVRDFEENGKKDYADILAKALIAKADEAAKRLTSPKYPDLKTIEVEPKTSN